MDIVEERVVNIHNNCLVRLNGDIGNESPTLYHYSSLESALSIIQGGKMRFTHIKYFNDPMEVEEGLSIIKSMREDLVSYYMGVNRAYGMFVNVMIYAVVCAFQNVTCDDAYYNEVSNNSYGVNLKAFKNLKRDFYVSCLSAKDDDLRLWLPYANNGLGAALGFKGVNDFHYIIDHASCKIVRVSYADNEDKKKFVKEFFDGILEVFKGLHEKDFQNLSGKVFELLIGDVIACKSNYYSGEDEWRLVVEYSPVMAENKGYVVKEGVIKPYISLDMDKSSLLDVKMGPLSLGWHNLEAMTYLLNEANYDNAKISLSKIKYRK